MKTITFYSYKGGTGRSLALANAARYLARLELKVVAVDLDLEAPGLHYKFSSNPDGSPLPSRPGIVDYLHSFIVEGNDPPRIAEFTQAVEIPGTGRGYVQLISAGSGPSEDYWQKLAQIDWHELFYSPTASGVQLFTDLKNRIEDELAPDFLLIDSRTGITEMAGVATTLFADKIVCLVVPTLENIEGARAVLRSLQRSRREVGSEPLDMTVAISRLPELDDHESERSYCESILKILNEPATNLRDTLTLSGVFVLHSEAALQIRETLRIGGPVNPEDSILLRDYLRLFANLVPKELIAPKVDQLIQQAKEKIWEDPDAAVKEVEELAESFGHPENYRALLRFYDVRNVTGATVLKRAQRLWELTRDSSDPAIWAAVQKNFNTDALRWRLRKEWQPDPDFLEAVWRGGGSRNLDFALRLSQIYSHQDKDSRAADVLLETMTSVQPTPVLAARCINYLGYAKRFEEASSLISQLVSEMGADTDFALAWARHGVTATNDGVASDLARHPSMDLIRQKHPFLAVRLLVKAGLIQEANELADLATRNISDLDESALREAAYAYSALKRWDEFEGRFKPRLSPSLLRELRAQFDLKSRGLRV